MTVRIREQTYHDAVGRSHRRRRWIRRAWISASVAAFLGGAAWLFLFSSFFAVTDINVQGAEGTGNENVARVVRERLAQRKISVFPLRNMVLLQNATISDAVRNAFDVVQDVAVTKDYPHTLAVTVTERHAIGIWCRGQECQFWDRSGARWGNPVPSVGPLLLRVQDERDDPEIDARMLSGMLGAVDALPDLGLHARSVRLPNGEPGGVRMTTDRGYDLYLDALGDVADQLDVLGIFLADRAKDAAFAPQYIDLRTPGRVYYR